MRASGSVKLITSSLVEGRQHLNSDITKILVAFDFSIHTPSNLRGVVVLVVHCSCQQQSTTQPWVSLTASQLNQCQPLPKQWLPSQNSFPSILLLIFIESSCVAVPPAYCSTLIERAEGGGK